MNEIIQFCLSIFSPLVVIFTVSNLFTMGLQVNVSNVVNRLKNLKFLALVLVWGWLLGPALGYLITKIIPLAEPYAMVMLITCLAPCAPFLPPMVDKARGDIGFAGALIPLVLVGTVVFMPLMAPMLIKGLTISAMTLAKPLIITLLIPLLIGALIRTYAASFATKIFKPVKALAGLTTVLTVASCILLYGKPMLDTTGSFALLSITIFMIVMGFITYQFGFGMKQAERSIMSLGMGTRNIAAAFAAILAIPNGDPRMLAMVVLWVIWSFILALIFAGIFGKRATKTEVVV